MVVCCERGPDLVVIVCTQVTTVHITSDKHSGLVNISDVTVRRVRDTLRSVTARSE